MVVIIVVLILALVIGADVLVGALLVWLASKAFAGVEFSWALAAFVGIALAVLQSIFKVTVKKD